MLRLSAEAVRLDTNLATTSSSTNGYPATEVAGIERHAPTTAQSKNVVALRVQPRPLNRIAQAHAALGDFLHHVRRRWYLYPPLQLIWTLAYVRVFFEPTPRVPLLFNWTPSLPYHVALLRPLSDPPGRGTYILYRFDGRAIERYPGLRGQPIFKQVVGVPGDAVTVEEHRVYINGVSVGHAKPRTFDGWPLATITPTVIPEGRYYVRGTDPDSFDSRYRASGLVRNDQIIGSVEPLF